MSTQQKPAAPKQNSGAKKGGKCRGGCAAPPGKPAAEPQVAKISVATPVVVDDKEEAIRKENLELKAQQKDLETKLDELQSQVDKTNLMNTRLEGLCAELKNRTKALTTESTSKIQEAEDRGKSLTEGVSKNLGLMNNINDSIQQITKDNLDSRKFNENLSQQMASLKSEQEKKEALIQDQIQEVHDKTIKAHMELAQTKVDNSMDKEKTFLELKKLATAIVESREQMQAIKKTELMLRQHLQNYDEKFVGLQTALKETNAAYDGFKGEMEKLAEKAKELEGDATKWQNKWEESTKALVEVEKTHKRLQDEIDRTSMNLQKMTGLYKALLKQQNQIEETKPEENEKGANSGPEVPKVVPTSSEPQQSPPSLESDGVAKVAPLEAVTSELPKKPEPEAPQTAHASTKSNNKKKRKGKK